MHVLYFAKVKAINAKHAESQVNAWAEENIGDKSRLGDWFEIGWRWDGMCFRYFFQDRKPGENIVELPRAREAIRKWRFEDMIEIPQQDSIRGRKRTYVVALDIHR